MEEKILNYLKEGFTQKEIAEKFANDGITPNSLSYIEKELKKIRQKYNAKTNFQLGFLLGKKTP
ncbi:helix-turn-helix transcriptional regulator [Flavobacterium columnare]|uniref:helix-turn-helix transcriptional regulator n=1 Tax=Flavobacterium columnare TaxID=996 RepID=UPI004033609F